MGWRRHVLVVLLAVWFAAGSTGGPGGDPPAEASPLRQIQAGKVSAMVPEEWDFQPLPARSDAREGIQASRNLRQWRSLKRRAVGLEAYWVDATAVGVPSDYYYLAAEGPAMASLPIGRRCERDTRRVLRNRRPKFNRMLHSPGDYVATASGTCATRRNPTRWVSFVAAPGFGPVRAIGIPESGLYAALVMVPEGPRALKRAERLLSRISFGGVRVAKLLTVAGSGRRLP